jgi:hypothetical protein
MTIHWHFEKSNRPALGGRGHVKAQAGSRGADTQYLRSENIIRFPSGPTFLPDSRASERELSISQDRIARFVLGAIACVFLFAIGLLLFAGRLIFDLVDLG